MDLRRAVGLLICLLIISGQSKHVNYDSKHLNAALHHYDTLHVDDINHTSSGARRHVLFSALGRSFHLSLEWDRHLFARDFAVYSVDHAGNTQPHHVDQKAFLHGHIENEKGSSRVTAHLSDEGVLSAVIVSANETYHIEPSRHYIREPHLFHMVAYATSHVKQRLNATRFDYSVPPAESALSHQDKQTLSKHHHVPTSSANGVAGRVRRQTVDTGAIRGTSCNMILIADHTAFQLFNSDVQGASSQLVLLASSVDKMIYRDTQWLVDVNDNVVVGLGLTIQQILVHTGPSGDSMNYNFGSPGLSAGDVLGLMRFGPWSEFCLAHLFTNRNFESGLLGLANIASPVEGQTGGICSRSFNDFSVDPPRTIIFNTGLSTYNNDGQIMILSEMIRVTGHELGHNWGSHHDPGTDGCGDGFLMNEFAQDGSQPSHMEFSGCSRRSIGEVLLNKGFCFQERLIVECGNYQVEADEECDVGTEGDQCCTPDCRLNDSAKCSDRNSLCCVGCQVADDSTVCRIGPPLSDTCTGDTFCNGVNITCISDPEPAPNGTLCIQGVCMLTEDPDDITECVPLCELRGMGDLCPCVEEQYECLVCCRSTDPDDESCAPLPDLVPLSNHSLCSEGVCLGGVCESQVQDQVARIWNIITSLNASAFRVFVEENIVGFTLIFSIPIWVAGSCLIHYLVDHRRMKRFERYVRPEDIARLFLRKRAVRGERAARDGSSEPLLEGKSSGPELEAAVEQVDEPVDDTPLPVSFI